MYVFDVECLFIPLPSLSPSRPSACIASSNSVEEAAPAPVPVVTVTAEDGPAPRLCHLKIWSDFTGYGFNLQSEKGVGGQFIGKVDDNSPAQAAGLIQGDKIMEVNGTSTKDKDHREIVTLIKSDATQTRLLVLDPEAFKYYQEKGVEVNSSMSNVKRIECPDSSSGAQSTPEPVVTAAGKMLKLLRNLPQQLHVFYFFCICI